MKKFLVLIAVVFVSVSTLFANEWTQMKRPLDEFGEEDKSQGYISVYKTKCTNGSDVRIELSYGKLPGLWSSSFLVQVYTDIPIKKLGYNITTGEYINVDDYSIAIKGCSDGKIRRYSTNNGTGVITDWNDDGKVGFLMPYFINNQEELIPKLAKQSYKVSFKYDGNNYVFEMPELPMSVILRFPSFMKNDDINKLINEKYPIPEKFKNIWCYADVDNKTYTTMLSITDSFIHFNNSLVYMDECNPEYKEDENMLNFNFDKFAIGLIEEDDKMYVCVFEKDTKEAKGFQVEKFDVERRKEITGV